MSHHFHRQDKPSVTMKIAIHPAVKRASLRRYGKSCYVSPAAAVEALMALYATDADGRCYLMDAGHYRPDQNSPKRRARRKYALKVREYVTTTDPARQRLLRDELLREKHPEDA